MLIPYNNSLCLHLRRRPHGRSLLRRRELKRRRPKRRRTCGTTMRLANGSASGDIRAPTRPARMIGSLRLMRRRRESEKKAPRGKAMAEESARRRSDGTSDYNGRMIESTGRNMEESNLSPIGFYGSISGMALGVSWGIFLAFNGPVCKKCLCLLSGRMRVRICFAEGYTFY
jgi:hypothetical protein